MRTTKGISMIELVVFILVMGIAFTGVMVVFINTQTRSADPMIRIKTVELGQALMDEILLKAYDDQTPNGGGCVRFAAGSNCPPGNPNASASLGTDGGESRSTFDDVDDYHNLAYCGDNVAAPDPLCTGGCPAAPNEFLDQAENDISTEYAGFSACIRLSFAGGEISPGGGVPVLNNDAKRIDVIITDPLNSRMTFTAYRLNY